MLLCLLTIVGAGDRAVIKADEKPIFMNIAFSPWGTPCLGHWEHDLYDKQQNSKLVLLIISCFFGEGTLSSMHPINVFLFALSLHMLVCLNRSSWASWRQLGREDHFSASTASRAHQRCDGQHGRAHCCPDRGGKPERDCTRLPCTIQVRHVTLFFSHSSSSPPFLI